MDRWTLIQKNGRKWRFSYETKPSIHLSQSAECIYGAQSLKERRLLWEFIFIAIERWTIILKMVEREVFLMKPQYQFIYPNKENVLMVSNHEKKRDYYVNPYWS